MSDTEPDHLVTTAVLEVPEITAAERAVLAEQRAADLLIVAAAIARQAPHTTSVKLPIASWRNLNDGHRHAFLELGDQIHRKARRTLRGIRKKRRGWA